MNALTEKLGVAKSLNMTDISAERYWMVVWGWEASSLAAFEKMMKGSAIDEIVGDMRPRSESRLAVLPNTTHITLLEKGNAIIPMVNDSLGVESQKK